MYPINSYINTDYLKLYMLSKTFLSYSTKNDTSDECHSLKGGCVWKKDLLSKEKILRS